MKEKHRKIDFNWKGKLSDQEIHQMLLNYPPISLALNFSTLFNPTLSQILTSDNNEIRFLVGENLRILNYLLSSGEKCDIIFFDPPYNSTKDIVCFDSPDIDKFWVNGAPDYRWFSMIRRRALLSRDLLDSAGIFIAMIDDKQMAPFKLILDEIFGKESFIGCTVWESMVRSKNKALFSLNHQYLLWYIRDPKEIEKNSAFCDNEKRWSFDHSIWKSQDSGDCPAARSDLIDRMKIIYPNSSFRWLNVKPIPFLLRVIEHFPRKDIIRILDPFMGSGSLPVALIEYSKGIKKFKFNYQGIQFPFYLDIFERNSISTPLIYDYSNPEFQLSRENPTLVDVAYTRLTKSLEDNPSIDFSLFVVKMDEVKQNE